MTIAGGCLFAIIIIRLLTHNDYKENRFFLFMFTIIVSIFVNVGYVFSFAQGYSYSEILMTITVCYSLFENKRVAKRELFSAAFLLISVFIALSNIFLNSSEAYIIPMNTLIDDVIYGFTSAKHPEFTSGNISAFFNLCMFMAFILFNRDFFNEKKYVDKIRNILNLAFKVFFVFMLLEFIISNITSGIWPRKIINTMFGVMDADKAYMVAPYRYGMYCAYGLFVEPSYVTRVIIYALLLMVKDKIDRKDVVFSVMSILVIAVTGSASCYMMIPLIICAVIYKGMYYRYGKFGKLMIILLCIVLVYACIVFISGIDVSNSARDSIVMKIASYMNGTETKNSGYTRSMGNTWCYAVLKTNPLFGVGIGTTRGYSFNAGLVANFGIIGIIAILCFYKDLCNAQIKGNIKMIVIVVGYFMAVWTVWDAYSPAIIGILICFNKYCVSDVKINMR